MSLPNQTEHRGEHRNRVLKGAVIVRSDHESELPCTIHNMHEDGAELQVTPQAHLPQEFLMYVAVDRLAYRCRLEWRRGGHAGVSFHGNEPKPAHLYG